MFGLTGPSGVVGAVGVFGVDLRRLSLLVGV